MQYDSRPRGQESEERRHKHMFVTLIFLCVVLYDSYVIKPSVLQQQTANTLSYHFTIDTIRSGSTPNIYNTGMQFYGQMLIIQGTERLTLINSFFSLQPLLLTANLAFTKNQFLASGASLRLLDRDRSFKELTKTCNKECNKGQDRLDLVRIGQVS